MNSQELRSERHGRTLVIHLGRAYASLNETLVDEVAAFMLAGTADPQVRNLVVDLSHTEFFGSRFIEGLFRAYNRIKRKQGRFALCGLLPHPTDVIRISKLDTIWPLFPNVEEALRVIEGGSRAADVPSRHA